MIVQWGVQNIILLVPYTFPSIPFLLQQIIDTKTFEVTLGNPALQLSISW